MHRSIFGLGVAVLAAAVSAQTTSEGGQVPVADPGPLIRLELPNSRTITVTGELRWRAESRQNYDFDDRRGAHPTFIDQRARLDVDFEANDELSVFLQLQDARTFGEETSTLDRSADGFDLHQGVLHWKVAPDIGGDLHIGRQEVALGSQRLISSLNWATQARSFDGVLFDCDVAKNVELIAFGLVTRQAKSTTDNQGAYLTGAWLAGQSQEKDIVGDVYLIGFFDDESAPTGTTHLLTAGGRIEGKWGMLDAGFEGALQYGETNGADIPAGDVWALHLEGGVTPPDVPWSPRIWVEGNVATGDDPATADFERFNTLFPFAHAYLGYMDFALWENIAHVGVHVDAKPGEKTLVRAAWHHLRAFDEGDRFAGPNNVLSTGGAGRSKAMGDELDLTCRHQLTTRIWGEAGGGLFLPGSGVKDALGTDDLAMFFYYMMGLKL